MQRAVLASGGTGELFVDTLKSKRARTVPLVAGLVPIVDRWAQGKAHDAWLFHAPLGGPLSEGNWKRSVRWSAAIKAIGAPKLRVHDLRHTAASVWLGSAADPKVGGMSQSAAQAAAFFTEVSRTGRLWTVRDAGGYPAPMNSQRQRAQPFWSSEVAGRTIEPPSATQGAE